MPDYLNPKTEFIKGDIRDCLTHNKKPLQRPGICPDYGGSRFQAEPYSGTTCRPLFEPSDDGWGAAAVHWARSLAESSSYDAAVEGLVGWLRQWMPCRGKEITGRILVQDQGGFNKDIGPKGFLSLPGKNQGRRCQLFFKFTRR